MGVSIAIIRTALVSGGTTPTTSGGRYTRGRTVGVAATRGIGCDISDRLRLGVEIPRRKDRYEIANIRTVRARHLGAFSFRDRVVGDGGLAGFDFRQVARSFEMVELTGDPNKRPPSASEVFGVGEA